MTVLDPSAAAPDVLRHRPRLLGLGYRMLGDLHEAEDLVQEAYLRWFQGEHDDIQSPEAWLRTVVSRLAVDRLRRAKTAREAYVGQWLPEPVATAEPTDRGVERSQDLSMAMLMMLERLAPEERAAFVLREVFDTGYGEIAGILQRSEAAVRQMVHRARDRVRAGQPRFAAPADARGELLRRFLDALAADDQEAVLALLAPDVTLTSDGGGKVAGAGRNVIVSADRVMRLLISLERKYGSTMENQIRHINGEPAVATFHDGQLGYTTAIATDGERITAIYRVLNPDKLQRVVGEPVEME
ncbi:MAG TPA: RNA polymerase sigma factor SigJ [Longimicrobium sp.]|nr:RNA polymerase sigma factor SigJ [Longimicrobium sp.]